MRSLLLTSSWAVLRKGGWNLLACSFFSIALPAVIFLALRQEGGFNPADTHIILIHIFVGQIGVFTVGLAGICAQEPPRRLATLPVPNTVLAAIHMLPVMALVFAHTLVSVLVLNTMFALEWPVWGPALSMTALVAAIHAMMWLLGDSVWLFAGLGAVAPPISMWFKSRYGSAFGSPEYYWRTVQPAEFAGMLVVALAAFGLGAVALGRRRRGEPPGSLGILAWLDRRLAPGPYDGPEFRSAERAQVWWEWRTRGWFIPASCTILALLFFTGWALFDRTPRGLFGGLVAGVPMMCVVGLVGGLVIGQQGPQGRPELGPFLATKPLSNRCLTRIVLRVASQSLAVGWSIWAASFAGGCAGIWLVTGEFDVLLDYNGFSWWWFFEGSVLGPWITLSLTLATVLTGRTKLFVTLAGVGLAAWLGGQLLFAWYLTPATQRWLARLLASAMATGLCAATGWWYWRAWRQALIAPATVIIATVVVVGVLGALALSRQGSLAEPWIAGMMFVSAASAAVAPLAAAPLALQWNRHR